MRDVSDKHVYLTASLTKRKCYEKYCYSIGWKIKFNSNQGGVASKTAVDDHESSAQREYYKEDVPSWTAYRTFWEKEYGQLKVSKPSEDICGYCFKFHNSYKFKQAQQRAQLRDEASNDLLLCLPGEILPMPNSELETTSTSQEGTPGPRQVVSVEVEADAEILENERFLIKEASEHVKMASAQQKLVSNKIELARSDGKNQVPHRDRTYTLIVDYAQNMELPWFGETQPGETYYYTPLAIYNFGVVDVSHPAGDHLYAHLYKEGDGAKGGNNVASLLMKTLRSLNLLQENTVGKELKVVFDNCPGQNKNNFVLWLVPLLVELGFFSKVNFIFLVAGHTKNAADRLFNLLKYAYRKENVATMEQLIELCGRSPQVTVVPVEDGDFRDYKTYLSGYYNRYHDLLKQHQFSCTMQPDGSIYSKEFPSLIAFTRLSDLEEHSGVGQSMLKAKFTGRVKGQKADEAIKTRKNLLLGYELTNLPFKGIPEYKQVLLHFKYRQHVDPRHHNNLLYRRPTNEVLEREKKDQSGRDWTRMRLINHIKKHYR